VTAKTKPIKKLMVRAGTPSRTHVPIEVLASLPPCPPPTKMPIRVDASTVARKVIARTSARSHPRPVDALVTTVARRATLLASVLSAAEAGELVVRVTTAVRKGISLVSVQLAAGADTATVLAVIAARRVTWRVSARAAALAEVAVEAVPAATVEKKDTLPVTVRRAVEEGAVVVAVVASFAARRATWRVSARAAASAEVVVEAVPAATVEKKDTLPANVPMAAEVAELVAVVASLAANMDTELLSVRRAEALVVVWGARVDGAAAAVPATNAVSLATLPANVLAAAAAAAEDTMNVRVMGLRLMPTTTRCSPRPPILTLIQFPTLVVSPGKAPHHPAAVFQRPSADNQKNNFESS
jgi:hypothetical protein